MFDEFLAVDWSAASSPKRGRDSVWLCHGAWSGGNLSEVVVNPSTRAEAMARVTALCEEAAAGGRRLLAGFDFCFGVPVAAHSLFPDVFGPPGPRAWSGWWDTLAGAVTDDGRNVNNRFEVADDFNRRTGHALFWGRPRTAPMDRLVHLSPTRAPAGGLAPSPLPPLRLCEQRAAGSGRISSVWQLLGAGSVGGQSLVGVHHLARLRQRLGAHLAVWPFSTGLSARRDDYPAVTLAEVWPSAGPVDTRLGKVRDEAQVRSLVRRWAEWSAQGRWPAELGPSPGRTPGGEGWILGVV